VPIAFSGSVELDHREFYLLTGLLGLQALAFRTRGEKSATDPTRIPGIYLPRIYLLEYSLG
jgi:hypothetical protein